MKTLKKKSQPDFPQVGNRSLKIILSLTIVSLIAAFTFTSCKKKEETPVVQDTEQGTANDNNIAEHFVGDIESMGAQVAENGTLAFRTSGSSGIEAELSPTATVTINGKIITIDFGTVGCLGNDGRTRTGKLVYDFSASVSGAVYYRNPGFNVNVTSQNYVVDNYSITILNKTITNTTPNTIPSTANPGTNLSWNITANVAIAKPNGGGSISWTCSRTKELINTNDTNCYRGQNKHIIWTKAIIKLNGNTTGTNAKNEQFTALATNLVRDFNCSPDPSRPMRHPFVSGTISYTPGSRPTRLVDFGNGACDLLATVTINSNSYSITLP